MFGRQPKETKQDEQAEMEEAVFSYQTSLETKNKLPENTDSSNKQESEKIEIVNVVEKISGIVSPYFIVLVGLLLYEENVLLGVVLIAVGMISLLKISPQDVVKFFDWVKTVLGLNK